MPACRSVLALLAFLATGALSAGDPVVRNVSVRGLTIGGKTTLVVDGDELGPAPRLLLPFAAHQDSKPKSTEKQATFEVTLGQDVIAGYHHLRVVNDAGVSLPVIIGVDRLPQRSFTAAADPLPVALHGTIAGSAAAETKFAGKAGQKLLIEVEAQRLGSKLRPVVHLLGPNGLQLAWAWPSAVHSGDTRLEATLAENGPHTIAIHDLEYAAQAPGFFRVKVGQWDYVDHVFPPALARGQKAVVELTGSALSKSDVATPREADFLPLAWPGREGGSGPRPFVLVSPHAEALEQGDAASPKGQALTALPIGVSGRLGKPHEEDRYRLPVKSGDRVRLEVFAERLGSPVDVALVVRNEAGAQVARGEDSPGSLDPVLEYAVPDKVTSIVVGVVDAQGRGGPRAVYRLTAESASGSGAGEYRLVSPTSHLSVAPSKFAILPVLVERKGYEGSIALSGEGLPAGLRVEGSTIPAGADGAIAMIHRDRAGADAVITRWTGKADDGATAKLSIKGHPLERLQPWLAQEIALATTSAKPAEFDIAWRDSSATSALVPARKLVLPVKLTRADDKGAVKLTLLTSQVIRLANNQPDPNQTIRLEKAIELGAKANETDVNVLVPAGLTGPVYDLTVQADLLSADKKTVLATAYAPVKRLEVRPLVVVKLEGPARREVALDAKKETAVKLTGEVERLDGLAGDVVLTVTGLPTGTRADNATVKAGAKAFAVNVFVPAGAAAGEIKGIKLSATAPADPKQPNVRVKSRDVELTLVVTAAK